MQNQNRNDDVNDPALIPTLRWMANMACLWGMCRNDACGRARQCKRDPRFCMRRYAPLLPDDVRDGVKLMIEGRFKRKDYDALVDEAPELIAAVEDWIARVNASVSPPKDAPQP